jgi:hypothetical protein
MSGLQRLLMRLGLSAAQRIQQQLTLLHTKLLRQRLTDPHKRSRTDCRRLESNAHGSATLWMNTLPSSPETSLTNEQFAAALRLSLGVRHDEFVLERCSCGANKVAPDHALVCSKLRARGLNNRHSSVAAAIAKYAAIAGALVEREPAFDECKALLQVDPQFASLRRQALPIQDADDDAESDKRPDLLLHLPNATLALDVTVVHTWGRSARVRDVEANIALRERIKLLHYQGLVVPIVLTSNGALSRRAEQLVDLLARCYVDRLPVPDDERGAEFKLQLKQELVIGIQRTQAQAVLQLSREARNGRQPGPAGDF